MRCLVTYNLGQRPIITLLGSAPRGLIILTCLDGTLSNDYSEVRRTISAI